MTHLISFKVYKSNFHFQLLVFFIFPKYFKFFKYFLLSLKKKMFFNVFKFELEKKNDFSRQFSIAD